MPPDNEVNSPTPAVEDVVGVMDFILLFAENLRLLIIGPLIIGLAALGISFFIQPTFTASTRILPPQQQQSSSVALASQLGALSGIAGAVAGIRNPAETYMAMLKSRKIADRLVGRFNLKTLFEVQFDEDARKVLTSRTRVTSGRDGLILVEFDDYDPKRAAEIANAYVEELSKFSQTLAVTEAGQRRLFFEKQLTQAKDNLTKAEITLRSSGISEAAIKTLPQSSLEGVARLKAQVSAQEVRVSSMRGYSTESNPEFMQAQRELGALRAQLESSERSGEGKAQGNGADYIAKYRDFKYHETLFELIARQFEIARLDEAREGVILQVIEEAIPPERKSKPSKAKIAMLSAIIAFFALLLFVITRGWFRTAASDPANSTKVERLRHVFSPLTR